MTEANANSRLEAFCDGVFAIAMTLLVIELKLPSPESIHSTADFWHALRHMAPLVFAFILSFGIILITWVNHHASLKLVSRSSASFIYANGFLLLTVVSIPFPTALLGALRNQLTKDETSTSTMRENRRNGFFAFVLYSLFSIIALWFPMTIAILTTLTWIFWLALGIRMKHA